MGSKDNTNQDIKVANKSLFCYLVTLSVMPSMYTNGVK